MRQPPYINSFNAIRLVAALHIVSGHFFEQTFMAHNFPAGLIVLLSSSASYSTSLFFVLSGFVLAYTRKRRDSQDMPREKSAHSFLRHLMRIVPYMLAGSALAALISKDTHGLEFRVLVKYLFSISLVFPYLQKYPPFNPPSWAMSVFVLGYFFDAFCGTRLGAISMRNRLQLLFLLTIFLYSLAIVYAFTTQDLPSYPPRINTFRHHAIHIFPLSRVLEVIQGMLLGSLTFDGYFKIQKIMKSIPFIPGILTMPLITLFNLISLFMLSYVSGKQAFLFTHGLLLVPLCVMLVAFAVSDGWVSRFGLEGLFGVMGKISLPVYLLHWPCNSIYNVLVQFARVQLTHESLVFMFGYFLFLFLSSIIMMAIIQYTLAWLPKFSNHSSA